VELGLKMAEILAIKFSDTFYHTL